jgi:biotin carboxyl carrier protein
MKIYKIKVNGKSYRVELESVEEVASEGVKEVKAAPEVAAPKVVSTGEGTPILAPIQGVVVDIKVAVGTKVKKGEPVVIIEAMKLENEVLAPADGEVSEIVVTKGKSVTAKELLLKIK